MGKPEIDVLHAAADLPFAVEPIEGAKHLLVALPKLRPGGTRPTLALRRCVLGLEAHRLYVGADVHNFVGPEASLAGIHTAAALVRAEAERLRVPLHNVITFGTSMGAVMGLLVGIRAEVGHVLARSPPILMGSVLRGFSGLDGPSVPAKRAAGELLDLVRVADGEDPVRFLDQLAFRMTEESRAESCVHFFLGEGDPVYPSVRNLFEVLSMHPTIQVRLKLGDYGPHSRVADGFFPYLRKTVKRLTRADPPGR